jgi:hypothetical protein
LKTLAYVALCLLVPPVWAVITYFVFGYFHRKAAPPGAGRDGRGDGGEAAR